MIYYKSNHLQGLFWLGAEGPSSLGPSAHLSPGELRSYCPAPAVSPEGLRG